jgi:hypothetical protein
VLDAEQKKAAAAALSNWFSSAGQAPDSGEIDSHHALFALLHGIYSRRLTGKLQLLFGRVEKALFFDGGQLVFASSSDSQDGLGEVMLRAGALTQSQFEEASTLVETGQRFGSAIAEMGIYGVEEIVGWVRRQVLQVVASVLDFPAGRYFFFSAPEKNVVPEIGAPVPLGKLLLEAVRKAGDLPLDRLGEDAGLRLELSPESLRPFKAVDLEDSEQRLLALMFQRISAKDIVSQSGLPTPEAARALYALLLLGFVAGAREAVKAEPVMPEAEPVVPTAPAALEEASLVQREESKGVPPAENVAHALPQLEEIPSDPEEPKETDAPPTMPVPLLRPHMISREVQVRATGIPPEKNGPERQLFNEETASVLLAESGGVIRLAAAVSPGQLLVLANVETKREVIAQVVRKRAYKPTACYVELEFVEAAPGFWGMEFSAATALLPKNEQDVATAAMVITAAATDDQPGILPPAPAAGELQTFKREVEELRGKPVSTETPAANAEASALAQLRAEVSAATPIPGPGDPLSTEAILKSGMDAAGAARPVEHNPDPAPWESAEQAEMPQPVSDFINSLPMSKRWRMPRGGFTPEFNRVLLGLAVLLVVLGFGTAWFKHWLPWQPAGATSKNHAAHDSVRVASDAPVTSEGVSAKSAPVSNAGAPGKADGSGALVEAPSSAARVKEPALKKNASARTTPGKPSVVRPEAKPASNPDVPSGKESAVVPPKLIHSEQAVASLEAMRDFERGNVVIDAVVGTSGEVHFISVISGPPSLRGPAVESLKQYKYEPATRNGQPVPAHVTITIHFRFEP